MTQQTEPDLKLTGGCQCRAVRYDAQTTAESAYFCHCRMCQRATGSALPTYVSVRRTNLHFEGELSWYQSSPIARRAFCAKCGTPIGFQYLEGSEHMDLTAGTFDDPTHFVPQGHFAVESINENWVSPGDLPRKTTEEHEPLVQRWIAATGAPPPEGGASAGSGQV